MTDYAIHFGEIAMKTKKEDFLDGLNTRPRCTVRSAH